MQLLKNADLDPAKNVDVKKNSVSDPYSSNPDPDPAKNLNLVPSYFFTLSKKIKIMLLL